MKVTAYTDTETDNVEVVLEQDDDKVTVNMTKDEFVKYVSGTRD